MIVFYGSVTKLVSFDNKKCEWCGKKIHAYTEIVDDLTGKTFNRYIPVNFCPVCGAPLNRKAMRESNK